VIESSLTSTLVHVVRGLRGVALPGHIDLVDPDAGEVEVVGVPLNAPQWRTVGEPRTPVGRVPWRAPTLHAALATVQASAESMAWLPNDARITVDDLARRMASLRNPAAHGTVPPREHAEAAWGILRSWHDQGCAHALAELRDDLSRWPHIDPRAFSAVQVGWVDARARALELARQRVRDATAMLKRCVDLAGLERRVERTSAQVALWTRVRDQPITEETLAALPLGGPQTNETSTLLRLRALCEGRRRPHLLRKRLSRPQLWLTASPSAFAAIGRAVQAQDATESSILEALDSALTRGEAAWRSEASRAAFFELLQNLQAARAELEPSAIAARSQALELVKELLLEAMDAGRTAVLERDEAAQIHAAAAERLRCAHDRLSRLERGVPSPCTCGECEVA
jgi:hypothetical protein